MSKIITAVLLFFTVQANGAIDALQFSSPTQEETYHQLTEQLRCPQCQNNSIADSNATIANDMRTKVFELLEQGKSKQEIVDYMVARYGHFVTYDPPLTFSTVLLWLLPIMLLFIGLGLFFKRHPQSKETHLDRRRLDALLRNEEEQK